MAERKKACLHRRQPRSPIPGGTGGRSGSHASFNTSFPWFPSVSQLNRAIHLQPLAFSFQPFLLVRSPARAKKWRQSRTKPDKTGQPALPALAPCPWHLAPCHSPLATGFFPARAENTREKPTKTPKRDKSCQLRLAEPSAVRSGNNYEKLKSGGLWWLLVACGGL